MDISERSIEANGLTFGLLEAGSGPLALCLHGFPDSAWSWRHLLPELAAAGFHAVAPFMRGYAPTSVPDDGLYQVGALSVDACALHAELGGDEDAVIIGHDWGAMATYGAAAWQPWRWKRVVAAAVPPAGSVASGFFTFDQLHRSWYMFLFQHPLAEMAVAMEDLQFIDRLWEAWSPGYDATDDLPRVKDCLRDPANLAAALGYYRATIGEGKKDAALDEVQAAGAAPTPQPTLYLHGTNDGAMGVELTGNAASFLPTEGSRVEIVEGTGHFLHLEQPAKVNKLIVDFVTGAA